MGLFKSKEEKDFIAAIEEIREFFDSQFSDWDKTLKLTISAKRATEFPVEKIEPVIRQMWVECYARGIVFAALADAKYKQIAKKIPNFESRFPLSEFNRSVSVQAKNFGELLGNLVYEIGQIKPDYLNVLEKHLEEPELTIIQNEAKIAVQQL